jgi:hypothetical protein
MPMSAGRVSWFIIGACIVLGALTDNGAAASAGCLSYASPVYVTGRLLRIVFPGPPNYDSVAGGDKPEPYFVLHLDRPVCVAEDPTDSEKPAVARVTDMQLMLQPAQYKQLRSRLGRQIRLSGVLVAAHTGHHHTPVMLGNVRLGG